MRKYFICIACLVMALCILTAAASFAAEEKATAKTWWQRLFNYPAKVTQDSATIVAETGKKSVDVVANEVKTVGEVTSGDVEKTADLVTEPIKGTVDTATSAVVGTVEMPVKAAEETE